MQCANLFSSNFVTIQLAQGVAKCDHFVKHHDNQSVSDKITQNIRSKIRHILFCITYVKKVYRNIRILNSLKADSCGYVVDHESIIDISE